jgi:hypothetical protein
MGMDIVKTHQHLPLYLKYWHVIACALAVSVPFEAHVKQQLSMMDDHGIACLQSMLVFHENMDEVESRIDSGFQGKLSSTSLIYPTQTCGNQMPWQIKKGEGAGKLPINNPGHASTNNKVSFAVGPAGALLTRTTCTHELA